VERKELLWEDGAPNRLSADGTPVQREGQSKEAVSPEVSQGKPTNQARFTGFIENASNERR
jgi:hypothetical protein